MLTLTRPSENWKECFVWYKDDFVKKKKKKKTTKKKKKGRAPPCWCGKYQ